MTDPRYVKTTLSTSVTDSQRLALVILAEEATELVQAATKALRFGINASHPFRPELGTNLTQIRSEAKDVAQAVARFEKSLLPAAPPLTETPNE